VNGTSASEVERVESYFHDSTELRRIVSLRDGAGRCETRQPNGTVGISSDPAADFDLAWLRAHERVDFDAGAREPLRLADLFCGAGGMTLGVLEAGRAIGIPVKPVFAADMAPSVKTAYEGNFNPARFQGGDLSELISPDLDAPFTSQEMALKRELGRIDILVGGPPCQGHSNLNNHTRRDDPKNRLYGLMARFAKIFKPKHIIIENVHGAMHDKGDIVAATIEQLGNLTFRRQRYKVGCGILHGERIGVPQTRHRFFIVASRDVQPDLAVWESLYRVDKRSFGWACAGLPELGDGPLDTVTALKPITKQRIDYLFDKRLHDLPNDERPTCHREKKHTYVSVYGRIREMDPAPTITTGFTVMGQGRFVHPRYRRTLTPREGARLQFFPDWFSFGDVGKLTRKELVTLIGNAVPPRMAYVLATELLR
jgi:DNA (cytosine-5)-methyltransferase 1